MVTESPGYSWKTSQFPDKYSDQEGMSIMNSSLLGLISNTGNNMLKN